MELNMEQRKLINNKNLGHSLIKGVAGSGKTTVAVYRIPFLLRYYCPKADDNILMVTFNKSLTKYIEYIYRKIPEDEHMELISRSQEESKLKISNIDKILFFYFKKYMEEHHMNLQLVCSNEKKNFLIKSINDVKKTYSDVKLMDFSYYAFLEKEISWIKACGYEEMETYQTVDRIGRAGSGGMMEGPQKIKKNSRTREAIFYLMKFFEQRLLKKNLCSFEDISLYALRYIQTHQVKLYTHILIDESQDLSKIQLQCLAGMYQKEKDYSSIIFIADTAQSIYELAWLGRGRNFTSIGFDMTGRSNSLAKNYRTTTQIAEAAYSLIDGDENVIQDINFVKPSLIDKQGIYPVIQGYQNISQEAQYIVELVKRLSKTYSLKDIAVIARTNRVLTEIVAALKNKIPYIVFKNGEMNFGSENVKLLTMHSIKGLEFKVVIIAGLSKGIIPNPVVFMCNDDIGFVESMERKLLYVGMTRATERLYMSYHAKPSKFVLEIEPKFLKLQDDACISSFYMVRIDDYLFENKIQNLYGNEEFVRQWFIQELLNTYHYPLDMIDVEYPVQLFSKPGFVDIVVFIYKNNRKIPFILFEMKQKEQDGQSALTQLKSYMGVVPECCYGVFCDGKQFKVLDRKYEIISDFPQFDITMLPSSVVHYQFINLKTGSIHPFLIDEDMKNEVIIEEDGLQKVYKDESLTIVDLHENIAAGQPLLIVEGKKDKICLPSCFVSSSIDIFAVTVKGDSMVDANIYNGDQIILHAQDVADNGQIVAVEMDGSTTLKRFRRMGNMVCLIPENQNYEPIVVDANRVRIMGIAVGIIKKNAS